MSSNNTLILIGLAVLAPCCVGGIYTIGLSNDAVSAETAALASYKDMMNVRDAGYQTVTSLAGADMLAWEQYQEIFNGALEGRYGDGGADAVLLAIQEHNPTPPVELRARVMDAMQDSQTRFQHAQTRLIDQQRAYAAFLQKVPNRWVLSPDVYPKALHGELVPTRDLDGDGRMTVLDLPIIVTSRTRSEFSSGEAEVINPYARKTGE